MKNERRGSEKLLCAENDLCTLTKEEIEQVSGGIGPVQLLGFQELGPDYFPLGTPDPDIFKHDLLDRALGKLQFGPMG